MITLGHVVDSIAPAGITVVRDRLLEMQAQGRKVYRLEMGDPSFPVPEHILEAIKRALDKGHTHYLPVAGIKPLREAIHRKLTEENRIPVKDPNHVLVTTGAMNALFVTFMALVNPGDEILVSDPAWTETADNVVLVRGVPVRVPLAERSGYRMEPGALEAAVTSRTRAIVINTPHNPTGLVVDDKTLAEILKIAERHALWVISDEAYEHILFDQRRHVSAGSLGYDKVISVFSMSKSYAMSGLRVGYLACNDDLLIQRMTKLLRSTTNGVNSATQHGAIAALTGPQDETRRMATEYQMRREALWENLRGVKVFHSFKPQGAFYLWARIDDNWTDPAGRRGGWAMTEYLIETASIGSAPGESFGPSGQGHVRLSFACATEQVKTAAKLLTEIL